MYTRIRGTVKKHNRLRGASLSLMVQLLPKSFRAFFLSRYISFSYAALLHFYNTVRSFYFPPFFFPFSIASLPDSRVVISCLHAEPIEEYVMKHAAVEFLLFSFFYSMMMWVHPRRMKEKKKEKLFSILSVEVTTLYGSACPKSMSL